MLTAAQVNRAAEISFELAMEEVKKLKEMQREESGGTEVYSGQHPEHGAIHIVVPPAGNSFLLFPFAIRQF